MKTIKTLFIASLFFICADLVAQPAPPPSQNPAPIPGLAWLAAGGAVIVWQKTKQSKD